MERIPHGNKRHTPLGQAPPPLHGRISSDLDALQEMHDTRGWLPGRDDIRPCPDILARKWAFMDMQTETYTSFIDAVLIMVFGVEGVLQGVCVCVCVCVSVCLCVCRFGLVCECVSV